jgi:hypothetical protein
MDPTFTSRGAHDRQGNGRHRVSDLLLVLGVAAVVLGVVMVSQGLSPLPSLLHRVPPLYSVPGLVERPEPAPDVYPGALLSPAGRVPATPTIKTAGSGPNSVVAACPRRLDLDHDWRLVLLAMARQRRRTLHPTAKYIPPDKHDIPASVLAHTKGAGTPAEASPSAT